MKQRRTIKAVTAIFLAVLFVLSLSACSSRKYAIADEDAGSYMNASPTDKIYAYSVKGDTYMPETEVVDGFSDATSSSTGDEPILSDSARKLIKDVDMHLETKEFDAFMAQLYDRIEGLGGYVQNSYVSDGRYYDKQYGGYYARSATVTVRIPAERLDLFCDGVAGISNVVSRRESTSDVTLKYYDTESHMKALQSEYDTLIGILEKCTKLSDVITVQQRITDVLYQIESYKTTLNNYDNLVAYSTVTMQIEEVKEETVVTEQTVGQRIAAGIRASLGEIREDGENFLVAFVAALPFLLMWAVVLVVAFLILRRIVRRSVQKYKERTAKSAENEQKREESKE